LVALGYQHSTVNHTYNFVNPITQVHTTNIDGIRSAMKANIARRHRTTEYIGNELFPFIWRQKNKKKLWERFLYVIGHIEYEELDRDAPLPQDILDAIDRVHS